MLLEFFTSSKAKPHTSCVVDWELPCGLSSTESKTATLFWWRFEHLEVGFNFFPLVVVAVLPVLEFLKCFNMPNWTQITTSKSISISKSKLRFDFDPHFVKMRLELCIPMCAHYEKNDARFFTVPRRKGEGVNPFRYRGGEFPMSMDTIALAGVRSDRHIDKTWKGIQRDYNEFCLYVEIWDKSELRR